MSNFACLKATVIKRRFNRDNYPSARSSLGQLRVCSWCVHTRNQSIQSSLFVKRIKATALRHDVLWNQSYLLVRFTPVPAYHCRYIVIPYRSLTLSRQTMPRRDVTKKPDFLHHWNFFWSCTVRKSVFITKQSAEAEPFQKKKVSFYH